MCAALSVARCQVDDREFANVPIVDAGSAVSGRAGATDAATSDAPDDGEGTTQPGGAASNAGSSDAGLQCGNAGAGLACSAAPECQRIDCDAGRCTSAPAPESTPLPQLGCLSRACDGSGGVESTPADALCDDSLFCTGVESCTERGACLSGGNPCPGPDGDADCSESCDESADACTGNDPAGTSCGGGRSCDGEGDCLQCLDDSHCAEATPFCNASGQCVRCLDDSACDDGSFCNGQEICNSQGQCVDGPDRCPGPDGDGDCSESCDETTDSCTANDPRQTSCGAGRLCDGAGGCPQCLSDAQCPGSAPFCADSGSCVRCRDASDCTDGVFCNGIEACDSQGQCTGGLPPCPGPDEDADCSESCDEGADACTGNDPQGSPCPQGQCTGDGACAECLGDNDCPVAEPHCLRTICVECIDDGDCPSPTCTRGFCGQANRCDTEVVCGQQ